MIGPRRKVGSVSMVVVALFAIAFIAVRFAKHGNAPLTTTPAPQSISNDTSDELSQSRRIIGEVASSGPPTPDIVSRSRRLRDGWIKALGKAFPRDVTFSDPACYAHGCLIAATYRERSMVRPLDAVMTTGPEFMHWPGMKHRSVPELNGGAFTATWLLMAGN